MFKKMFFLFLTVTLALSACSTLEIRLDQTPTPGADYGEVATIVAATMAAIPSATAAPTATPALEVPSVLPRSLYYLDEDTNGKLQIYRLDRDGTTKTQITFEKDSIRYFDISLADGAITYFIQNQIIIVDQNGKDRHLLIEDATISSEPIWSPDGAMIAYGTSDGSTYLYTLATKNTSLLLAGTETETFRPKQFSPNSKKIIIQTGTKLPTAPEGVGAKQIYDFDTNTMTPIIIWGRHPICKRAIAWASNDSLFCAVDSFAGVDRPGLWRVNANGGSSEVLITGESNGPILSMYVSLPHQDSNGQLYYLYVKYNDQNNLAPALSLARSDADGVTNRVILRPDTFRIRQMLWALDGNAMVIFQSDENGRPLNLILLPINPSQPVVTLLADASKLGQTLRWGP